MEFFIQRAPVDPVYIDRESSRLAYIMAGDPDRAADELRNQLYQFGPQSGAALLRATKEKELNYIGGAGDLQIQVEYTPNGCDSGFRNVTMASQNGIEQIAEIQAHGERCGQQFQPGYGGDPLANVATFIVGDLLWEQRHGANFNDPGYSQWYQREQYRQNDWQANQSQFQQNWHNQSYRMQYQQQNYQQSIGNTNNTYISNPRIDTTHNAYVTNKNNTTIINQTTNNYQPRTTQMVTPHASISTGSQERQVVQQPHVNVPATALQTEVIRQQTAVQRPPQERPAVVQHQQAIVSQSGEAQQAAVRQAAEHAQQQQALQVQQPHQAEMQHQQQAQQQRQAEMQQQQQAQQQRQAEMQHQQQAQQQRQAEMQQQQQAQQQRQAEMQHQQQAQQQRQAEMQQQQQAQQQRQAAAQAAQQQQHQAPPPPPKPAAPTPPKK